MVNKAPILELRNTSKFFPAGRSFFGTKGYLKAVDGISFKVFPGETLALVGESGCGKSTSSRLALGLEIPTSGEVFFQGVPLKALAKEQRKRYRQEVQVVFQDSNSSLNPRKTIGQTLVTALRISGRCQTQQEAEVLSHQLLEDVGLSPAPIFIHRFPHELSGGQRQRVGIARALAPEPELIIADEAVSALDISVRAQILTLLAHLQAQQGLAYLFISHDLAVVRSVSHRVAVMYLGKIVETAQVEDVFKYQIHPYTEALISATPVPDPVENRKRKQILLRGDVPSPLNPPPGCCFHPRCPMVQERCKREIPALREVAPGHMVSCLLANERWTYRAK